MEPTENRIIKPRLAKLRQRNRILDVSETEFSTGLMGPALLQVYFVGAFATGVAYDAVKSAFRSKGIDRTDTIASKND